MVKRACVVPWPPEMVLQDHAHVGDLPAHSTLRSPIHPPISAVFRLEGHEGARLGSSRNHTDDASPCVTVMGMENRNNKLFRVLSK